MRLLTRCRWSRPNYRRRRRWLESIPAVAFPCRGEPADVVAGGGRVRRRSGRRRPFAVKGGALPVALAVHRVPRRRRRGQARHGRRRGGRRGRRGRRGHVRGGGRVERCLAEVAGRRSRRGGALDLVRAPPVALAVALAAAVLLSSPLRVSRAPFRGGRHYTAHHPHCRQARPPRLAGARAGAGGGAPSPSRRGRRGLRRTERRRGRAGWIAAAAAGRVRTIGRPPQRREGALLAAATRWERGRERRRRTLRRRAAGGGAVVSSPRGCRRRRSRRAPPASPAAAPRSRQERRLPPRQARYLTRVRVLGGGGGGGEAAPPG